MIYKLRQSVIMKTVRAHNWILFTLITANAFWRPLRFITGNDGEIKLTTILPQAIVISMTHWNYNPTKGWESGRIIPINVIQTSATHSTRHNRIKYLIATSAEESSNNAGLGSGDYTVPLLTDEFLTRVIDWRSLTGQWLVYNSGSNFVCQ